MIYFSNNNFYDTKNILNTTKLPPAKCSKSDNVCGSKGFSKENHNL